MQYSGPVVPSRFTASRPARRTTRSGLALIALLLLAACSSKTTLKSAAPAAAEPGAGGHAGAAAPALDAGLVLPDASDAALAAPGVELDCASAAEQHGNAGCRFHAVPIAQAVVEGSCFAIFVANPGSQPATIKLERAGQNLPLGRSARLPRGSGRELSYLPLEQDRIPPGQVAIVFLAQTDGQLFARCPSVVMPAVTGQTSLHLGIEGGANAGLGSSFHLVSDRPVIAYQVFPYGGGSSAVTSATLLLPEESWGKSYLAVHPAQTGFPPTVGRLVAVVAAQDDTTVTMRPTVAVGGAGGVPAIAQGALGTIKLRAGQYVELGHPTGDLTGSVIAADKPVGLFGGAPCLQLPKETCCCDSAHQQIPPLAAWGHEYAAVHHPSRAAGTGKEESGPWRLVGAVDGTQLSYDWTSPAPPAGAPMALGRGQVVEFTSADPFVVHSQDAEHPFYLAGYMTGGMAFDGAGDPEFVNVQPTAQFLSSYVFFTDPSYPETHLVVVRRKGSDGKFADVRLACSPAPLIGWQPLGEVEFTRVALSTGNWQPAIVGCDNGQQRMESTAPFGVTVWGWGSKATGVGDPAGQYPHTPLPPWYTRFASYAYPAGASVGRVNQIVVIP